MVALERPTPRRIAPATRVDSATPVLETARTDSADDDAAVSDRRMLNALDDVRLRQVGLAIAATGVVLGVLLFYALLPGHYPLNAPAVYGLLGVAALGTAGIALLPWPALAARRLVLPVLYAWTIADVALVSAGVAVTGGSRSDIYLVYFVLCVFVASVSIPRLGRAALTGMVVAAYLLVLVVTGWHIDTATLFLRLGMIVATAAAADVLAIELMRALRFHARATEEFEHRAALWSRVADLGRALSSLDEQGIMAWAVDAVSALDFEAANMCIYGDGGRTYRVAYAHGLPDAYVRSAHPTDRGMVAMVQRERRTVVVPNYFERDDVVPMLRADGFRTVVATPVWVEGELAAALVAGTRHERTLGPEEVSAVELLAAHAGHGIESARKLEHQRRDAAHFRSLIQSAPDAMIVMDAQGRILEANHQLGRLFGYRPAELMGEPVELLMSSRSRHLAERYRQSFVNDPRTLIVGDVDEIFGLRTDGTEFPLEVVLGPIETPEGLMVTATVRDVTERRDFEHRLEHQATHDHLTGLPNRTQFYARLAEALGRTNRSGPPIAVCFLDVDHFKYVNDSRGHATGDALLTDVARRIESTARAGDVVARFGGDEFAVLVEGLTDRQGAVAYAWRLLAAFDRPFVIDGVDCFVSASVGIAFAVRGDDPNDVLRNADAAMYHAKQRGRARVELFDETLTARAVERLDIESSLHQAVLQEQLSLVFQPVLSLEHRQVVGAEALLRWEHPDRGMVPPLSFIPIAEESGLILQIGRWVLSQACRHAAAWLARARTADFKISVNVSTRQLEHDRLIGDVAAALQETGLPPHCLVLEITESFFMHDLPGAVRRLEALKRLGVRIAIDDFGTGFSSLNSLSRLPIDVVKIDKSFIDGLGTRYDAVIGAVVEVASAFDLEVVAEGIEHEDQVERLLGLGCRQGQGYLLGRPAPSAELSALFGLLPPA